MVAVELLILFSIIAVILGATLISLLYRRIKHRNNLLLSKKFFKESAEEIYNNILSK